MGWFDKSPRLPVGDEAEWMPARHTPAPVAPARLPNIVSLPAIEKDTPAFLQKLVSTTTLQAASWVLCPIGYCIEIASSPVGVQVSYDDMNWFPVSHGDILPPPIHADPKIKFYGYPFYKVQTPILLNYLRPDVAAIRRVSKQITPEIKSDYKEYATTDGGSITTNVVASNALIFWLHGLALTVSTLGTAACYFALQDAQSCNSPILYVEASAAVGTVKRVDLHTPQPLVLDTTGAFNIVKTALANEPAVTISYWGHATR